MDERGVQRQHATTAIKTHERSKLQRTDMAVTTCRLPLRYRGVERNLRKLTKPRHHAYDYRVTYFYRVLRQKATSNK